MLRSYEQLRSWRTIVTDTARNLVDHWSWASDKGLMIPKTANGFAAACRAVLDIQDGWEDLDVKTIDIEDFLVRFKNLKRSKYTPRSLSTYEGRFRRAVELYLEFVSEPSKWRYSPRTRTPSRRTQPNSSDATPTSDPDQSDNAQSRHYAESGSEIEYRYQIRPRVMARLVVPMDATVAEFDRLLAWAKTLPTDFEPS